MILLFIIGFGLFWAFLTCGIGVTRIWCETKHRRY